MTSPTELALARAAERIAQAWSQRSAAEQAGFTQRLTRADTPPLPDEQAVQRVRVRAALSGAVSPNDLVAGVDEPAAAHLLDVLAPEFDHTYDAQRGWFWTLRSAARQDVLARLSADSDLADALADAATVPTDASGNALRDLVQGRRPDETPAIAVQALAWAAPLGGLAGDLAEARRRARVQALADSYGVLLERGFFGRQEVLARLRAFAEAPVEPSGAGAVPLLAVTGIGGAGKSTVLAEFMRPYLERIAAADPDAPAVIVIDFDRLHFRPNAELDLSYEVTRQLGAAHPVAGADFSALRYQVRETQRGTGSTEWAGPSQRDVAARDSYSFEMDAGVLVRMHGLESRPVLLVLDTFEEWQREGWYPDRDRNDPEWRILAWIDRIRHQMDLRGLRVVISGRAEVAPVPGFEVIDTEHLADLSPEEAGELLVALDLTPQHAAALAGIVGGNPLTLRVAERFFRRLDPSAREAFLAGGAESTDGLTEELRRSVLYERFLEHIPDRQVRRLAHPGLVLRRVTPALVRHVLAPHCDLHVQDDADAARLTERLADEVWLVKETPDGLRHQPDVRRAMLRLMVDDPKYATTVRAIHEAALRWYEDQRDDLPPDQAAVEALYHLLSLQNPAIEIAESTATDEWRRLAQALGEAVAEFPPRLAAQVRVLRGDDITDADAAVLPDAVWQRWAYQRGRALVEAGDATRAVALLTGRLLDTEPDSLAQACCDAAQWDRYWPFVQPRSLMVRSRDPRVRRYAVVNAIAASRDDAGACADWLAPQLDELGPRDIRDEAAMDLLFYSLLVEPVARDRWRRAPLAKTMTAKQGGATRKHGDRFPVDQFRRALLWIAAGCAGPPLAIDDLAGLYRPDERWPDDFAKFTGQTVKETLVLPRGPLRADELLGERSAQFARAHGMRVLLRRDRMAGRPDLIEVLRGDNPEFRPAIRLALTQLLTKRRRRPVLVQLSEIARFLLPTLPADLTPNAMPADDATDAYQVLGRLIEYVDRLGVTSAFLDAARMAWPNARELARTQVAFSRWDFAYARVLDTAAERLHSRASRAMPRPVLTVRPFADGDVRRHLLEDPVLASLGATAMTDGAVSLSQPASAVSKLRFREALTTIASRRDVRGVLVSDGSREAILATSSIELFTVGLRRLATLLAPGK